MQNLQLINIHQAKTHLSRLVKQVSEGDEIIIGKAGKPKAKLIPYQEFKQKRQPGGWQGKVWMSKNFDKLPKELMKYFQP